MTKLLLHITTLKAFLEKNVCFHKDKEMKKLIKGTQIFGLC